MKKQWIVLGVAVAVIFFSFLSLINSYNKLVNLEVNVQEQFAQIDTVLQRRNDLIPNLVAAVKGIAKQEKEVFGAIADARARLAGAKGINDKVKANNDLTSAISRLLVVVENYPQLRSSDSFLRLQDQLEGAENRISVERNRYNRVVGDYNRVRRSFPMFFLGRLFGFDGAKEFFKAPETAKAVPKVEF